MFTIQPTLLRIFSNFLVQVARRLWNRCPISQWWEYHPWPDHYQEAGGRESVVVIVDPYTPAGAED